MFFRRLAILGGLCVALAISVHGQCGLEDTRSAKASKWLERAKSPKPKDDLDDQMAAVREALELHPDDAEAWMMLAEFQFKALRRGRLNWEDLLESLGALEELCPEGMPEAAYMRAAFHYNQEAHEEALRGFQHYLTVDESLTRASRRRDAQAILGDLAFRVDYHRHEDLPPPLPIPQVSQPVDEYLPMLAPDGTMLFYTRIEAFKAKGDVTTTRRERFTVSHLEPASMEYDQGAPMERPFNEGTNFGGASLSVDNKTMVIAALNPVRDNPNNIDLFQVAYELDYRDASGKAMYMWSELTPLGPGVNSALGWEAQPSISADGQTLLFAGARAESTPDRNGNLTMDLFLSRKAADGSWSPAEKLPPPVNSDAQDKSPFLHPDGKTLYFSSNRTPSGGGFDVWRSQRDSTGRWSEPINMGLPLNSNGDEHGLVVSTDGTQAIFASRRRGTQGLDLCAYDLPDTLKPEAVTVVKGALGWPLPEGDFTVSIEYVQSKRVEQIDVSRDDGTFAQVVRLPEGEDVVLTVEGETVGYNSQVVHMQGDPLGASFDMSLDIEPVDDGAPFELEDVQFATKKSQLSPKAEVMLQALANRMERQPQATLDIEGHTDDVGSLRENQALSVARAQAVKNFLTAQGVAPNRLSAAGFGESRPKTDNNSADGRSVNRRTEFSWRD
jgi:outer membrane protein OmpA-like peptidoglycan-associated protein